MTQIALTLAFVLGLCTVAAITVARLDSALISAVSVSLASR